MAVSPVRDFVLNVAFVTFPVLHVMVAVSPFNALCAQLPDPVAGFGRTVTLPVMVFGTPAAAVLPMRQLVSLTLLNVTFWGPALVDSPGVILAAPLMLHSAPRAAARAGWMEIRAAA